MIFQVYCHEDSKVSLNVVGQESVLEFDDLLEAIQAARQMSTTGDSQLMVYDPLGVVIFETLI